MTVVRTVIRRGAYYDSVVLMGLQKALSALPGILDAGVVMGTDANKDVLAGSELLSAEAHKAKPEDLIIAIKAGNAAAAEAALARVDELLSRRRSTVHQEYRPHSLETAIQMLPDARWVLVSVPGRYAAGVARDALRLGRHVFLYSDNVPVEEEVALKGTAREKGLLVMGPDCGTAIINGVGLGFANYVRRGCIGLVGATGTGLQEVTSLIHRLGEGITHAIGTGTRDLSDPVGAVTAQQGLGLLGGDPETAVIVLLSKPPSPPVADAVLRAARATGKPVVVDFIGYPPPEGRDGNLHFARTLHETAERAVALARETANGTPPPGLDLTRFAPGQRYLRGLYAGGTLAYEALLLLHDYLGDVYSNAPLDEVYRLASSATSQAHTVLDLGADEFTVGRLHPMLDNDLRIRRLRQEADDPEVAVIMLDLVLGYGTHPDPARELGPAIAEARSRAAAAGRHLVVVAVVVGTDEDPQDYEAQVQRLTKAGARVETNNAAAVRFAGGLAGALERRYHFAPLDLAALQAPFAAINVGIEAFYESLRQQNTPVIHVDWRPPAGGDERLMAILERLKKG